MMEGPGAESEEKREPASDIETATVDSLKVLDPERPIREADMEIGRDVRTTDERRCSAIARSRLIALAKAAKILTHCDLFFISSLLLNRAHATVMECLATSFDLVGRSERRAAWTASNLETSYEPHFRTCSSCRGGSH
jgi:hypothetical protein